MHSVEFSSSSCRICLQQGATYPIFDDSNSNIRAKLQNCLAEKIEDLEGYPRNICANCKITLDMFCEFIDTYKNSCKLLREALAIVKTEVDCSFSSHDHLGEEDNCTFTSPHDLGEQIDVKIENLESQSVNNICKENNNDTCQILEKLKPVPGLKITKVGSKENFKEKVSKKTRTTKKASSKRISKAKTSKTKVKKKQFQKKEEPLVELEIEDDIENRKNKMKEKLQKMKQGNSVLCDYCGAIFNKKEKLTTHMQSQHMNMKITCTVCRKVFSSEVRLKQHNRRLHGEKILPCEYCKNMFADRGVLNAHIKRVHNKHLHPQKLYSCSYCDKVYKAFQAWVIHERSVHTGIKPDVCTVCGKAFAHSTYLRVHMRNHTGEQPHKCPICDRGYSQLCNMKSHLKQHKRSELNDKIMPKMRPSLMKYLKAC